LQGHAVDFLSTRSQPITNEDHMSASQSLNGQAAIVTGANSGIGAAVASALATAGAKIGINYVSRGEVAQKMAADIRADGGDAVALYGDVSSEGDVAKLFAEAAEAFGRIDILVANAGVQHDALAADMTIAQWNTVIGVDLTGQFLCAREAIRHFRSQGMSPASKALGKIICMSSVHQMIPWAGHVNYAASKGGIMMMMRSLAQEVAGEKIRINAIAPGAIKTPINQSVWSDSARVQELMKLIPYGRIGEAEDVAKAAVWLASDDSDYVVGTSLFVDGGMTLYPGFRGNG
jgi:glucose 1-dehydrogenase